MEREVRKVGQSMKNHAGKWSSSRRAAAVTLQSKFQQGSGAPATDADKWSPEGKGKIHARVESKEIEWGNLTRGSEDPFYSGRGRRMWGGGGVVSMWWKWWGVADKVDSARSRGDRGPVAVEARAGDGAGGASRGSSESERES
jgi:hypothetical protein